MCGLQCLLLRQSTLGPPVSPIPCKVPLRVKLLMSSFNSKAPVSQAVVGTSSDLICSLRANQCLQYSLLYCWQQATCPQLDMYVNHVHFSSAVHFDVNSHSIFWKILSLELHRSSPDFCESCAFNSCLNLHCPVLLAAVETHRPVKLK